MTGAAVGLAASSALLTSACDPEDGLTLPGLPDAEEEPDRDQVLQALQHERAVLDQMTRVRHRHRELRSGLDPALAVHQAHVKLLSGAVADPGPGETGRAAVPTDPAKAAATLVQLESGLADQHVSTAMACRSGNLARVVAVMSAAAAQQAVVLAPLAVAAKKAGT